MSSKKTNITDASISSEKFIKDTVEKLQSQLTKLILDTNYTNSYSLYLNQRLSSFQEKLNKPKKIKKNVPTSSFLPSIIKSSGLNVVQDVNSIYKIKPSHSLQDDVLTKRKAPGNPIVFPGPALKVTNNKFLKYSNENRNQKLYQEVFYDNNFEPIIRNKEVKRGLLDMINKGLIPKIADLSPAFERNGNPMVIDNSKNLYRSTRLRKYKDEISDDSAQLGAVKYKIDETPSAPKTKKKTNTFITNVQENDKSKENEITDVFINPILVNQNNISYNNQTNREDSKNGSSMNLSSVCRGMMMNNSSTSKTPLIEFVEFYPIEDDNYKIFISENASEKQQIMGIFESLTVLFRTLNLKNIRIDCNKVLELALLAKQNVKYFTNQDLLFCISSEDLRENNLDPQNEKVFLNSVRRIFAIKIQSKVRQFLAYKRLIEHQIEIEMIKKIQSTYRQYVQMKKVRGKLSKEREKHFERFKKIQAKFQEDWDSIQDMTRVEIHINSINLNEYKNTTVDKRREKENLQLCRLIRLVNPNVEIIYVSPYQISKNTLNYYFSILNKIGVTNVESRFHLIVPESVKFLPCHYSLSKLLYFSREAQEQIRQIIFDRTAYIVPGIASKIDEEIACQLECPIFMGTFQQTEMIFNKSGAKTVFEQKKIAFPISAWDIKNEEEFFSSLTHLISSYPTINVWVFKMNNEYHGRGIAYIDLSTCEEVQKLKLEKTLKPDFTIELYTEKLYYILVSYIKTNVKICFPELYPTWKEYLKDFIRNKGIIESCPTNDLSGVMGSPALPMLIEPNGKIRILPTYDKININYFKNVLCTSPQKSVIGLDVNSIGNTIGEFLYSQGIIGYVTVEFITFHDGKRVLFWGVDLKFGLTDEIASIQYAYFLYVQTVVCQNTEKSEMEGGEQAFDYGSIIQDACAFCVPYLSDNCIRDLVFKEFLTAFRYENLIFDLERKEGVIFNFADNLEGGIFGMCGVVNLDNTERRKGEALLWKMIEKSLRIILTMINQIRKNTKFHKYHRLLNDRERTDNLRVQDIFSRVKVISKNKNKQLEDEKKRLGIKLND